MLSWPLRGLLTTINWRRLPVTRDEHIAYWLAESDKDLVVMQSLFGSGHYTWALFVGHLALEKALKGLYVQRIDLQVLTSITC
ncbi:MAG TPA: HEPN domain-containing protein [Desulfurivibrio alkaliphilus]|uniref:HEPN domain-containing protein n=1 Tax=Desulfurivibrio alkaliphilus TaxID=427923 RepID=A0A7C2XVF4_9BACT|nr:HEPN domain-containing protein [Desulfurivibrio alkaliphilus]